MNSGGLSSPENWVHGCGYEDLVITSSQNSFQWQEPYAAPQSSNYTFESTVPSSAPEKPKVSSGQIDQHMEICNFEEDISNGSRSIFDQEWHFVIRMQNQGDGTLVDPSDIFVESQSYSPDGEAQPDHATSRFSMDESGHLAPLSAHLAPLNAHIDRRLLAPCVSAAMVKTPQIGIPWVMIGNSGGKRFYLAFSIKIATQKRSRVPFTCYARFPEIIPDLVYDIETNVLGTRASRIGEAPDVAKYQTGHFGCAEFTPAINNCCIEWSEVFMGGSPLIQGVTVGVLRKWRGIMVGDIRAHYKEKPVWWPESVRYMGPANLERDDLCNVLNFLFTGSHGCQLPFNLLKQWQGIPYITESDKANLRYIITVKMGELSRDAKQILKNHLAYLNRTQS
ncbi:uncharacterized protein N7483_002446 [Penicillium malachiteum]|uniref:uncharacterized protein n=1 Tax=Penicillium malachiteum TaxID=1324776 RepID=UPI002549278F|nr:uncharacterized protein N7483_002446 [Penicillium malachiteum]KAJ5737321.1 hypothetical protein N7483_002446 [Penicillium malachiteum]